METYVGTAEDSARVSAIIKQIVVEANALFAEGVVSSDMRLHLSDVDRDVLDRMPPLRGDPHPADPRRYWNFIPVYGAERTGIFRA